MLSQFWDLKVKGFQKSFLQLNEAFKKREPTEILSALKIYDLSLKSVLEHKGLDLQTKTKILNKKWERIYDSFLSEKTIPYELWRINFANFNTSIHKELTAYKKAAPSYFFTQQELEHKRSVYTSLANPLDPDSDRQWLEMVDYSYQKYGKMVFDKGLHGFYVEPGFAESWYAAKKFLSENLDTKFSSAFYLQIHGIACRHFKGQETQTLMGQESVGVFRTLEDTICWSLSTHPTTSAKKELDKLNHYLKIKFGVELAYFDLTCTNPALKYYRLSCEKIAEIFDYFVENFHSQIESAKTPEDKLRAICLLIRNMEWSHSVKDGCGRCDMLILNFLLVQHGFNPVILVPDPYICNLVDLEEWVDYVKMGMKRWQKQLVDPIRS